MSIASLIGVSAGLILYFLTKRVCTLIRDRRKARKLGISLYAYCLKTKKFILKRYSSRAVRYYNSKLRFVLLLVLNIVLILAVIGGLICFGLYAETEQGLILLQRM